MKRAALIVGAMALALAACVTISGVTVAPKPCPPPAFGDRLFLERPHHPTRGICVRARLQEKD